MFTYSYCYVCSVLCILFLYVVLRIVRKCLLYFYHRVLNPTALNISHIIIHTRSSFSHFNFPPSTHTYNCLWMCFAENRSSVTFRFLVGFRISDVSKCRSTVIFGGKVFSGCSTVKNIVKRRFETSRTLSPATPPNILEDLQHQQHHRKNIRYHRHICNPRYEKSLQTAPGIVLVRRQIVLLL